MLEPKRIFLTGGAGFIGSHVVSRVLDEGHQVTVYDNLSSGQFRLIEQQVGRPGFTFVDGDILDTELLTSSMAGHDLVWHLAANTDIRAGSKTTDIDLKNCVIGTYNVLEAMHQTDARELLFASSGVVYGDVDQNPLHETAGPLLPVSLYGAGKLSGEAFVSAYCHLFDLRAWMFRFANVIGDGTNHGVVYDFVQKLLRTPDELEVLGDGNQLKPYFLVEECVDGMLYAHEHAAMTPEHPCDVFNLGTDTFTTVATIAQVIVEEMDLPNATIRYTGGRRGWAGDAPVIQMGAERMRQLGWTTKHNSDDAVRIAARRMIQESRAAAPRPG